MKALQLLCQGDAELHHEHIKQRRTLGKLASSETNTLENFQGYERIDRVTKQIGQQRNVTRTDGTNAVLVHFKTLNVSGFKEGCIVNH